MASAVDERGVFLFHRHRFEAFTAYGTEQEARAYWRHLNIGLMTNLWAVRWHTGKPCDSCLSFARSLKVINGCFDALAFLNLCGVSADEEPSRPGPFQHLLFGGSFRLNCEMRMPDYAKRCSGTWQIPLYKCSAIAVILSVSFFDHLVAKVQCTLPRPIRIRSERGAHNDPRSQARLHVLCTLERETRGDFKGVKLAAVTAYQFGGCNVA